MRGLRTRRLLASVAGLVLVFGIAACGDDDDDSSGGGGGEAQLDLKIGDLIPLTGDLADFGPPGQKAADLAVAQINAAIKEVGADHTVTITHEDTETNEQASVQAARKAVGDGATCITGAWASSSSLAVARSVTTREGLLQISPASTSDEITGLEDDGLVNRTAPPDSFQGPTLADAIAEDLGGAEGKTVNIGARNDAYGEGLAETFTSGWEALGGSVGETVIYDPEQPSYNSEAGQITSGNPDATVIIDFPETFSKVGPALERTGNFDASTTWITDGLVSGDLLEGPTADIVEGIRGTAPGAPDDLGATVAFDKLFTSSAPNDIDRQVFDAQNFDAVVLCYLAAVAAGSTDGAEMAAVLADVTGPGGTEYTWEQLPEAIEALQNGDDIDYTGAAGAIDLDEAGDATSGVYDLYQFKGGDLAPYDEVAVATPEG